ncbi:MAG: hypothetical protein BAJALOKI3v1_50141 [Promethearchaeota archaeon]|nr:MAG: hypothetical protein BAJALOKI3v1_50141 [Candidatus Lokiarchaeota archaeon]
MNNLAELQDKSNNQTINNIPDLQKLTSLEKQIIYRKYWRNNTHRQLADYFGKSNTTIQNILESALNKLKEN